jgi:hypothetical protein
MILIQYALYYNYDEAPTAVKGSFYLFLNAAATAMKR